MNNDNIHTMPPVAIQTHGVCASLGTTPILHDITLSVQAGRWTSIVGPNGAGKSTLLMALAGLLPCQGQVTLAGQPLAQWPRRKRAQHIAWLGQGEPIPEAVSVYDLVMLGRLPHRSWLAPPGATDCAAVEHALRTMQAWGWRDRSVTQLSGGERQRVLLARALAVQAPVLLMDEPLANLDPPHQTDWLLTMRALIGSGKTVVSVLHEISMALHADDMVVMAQGRVRHQGPCADPATHRALEQVFDERISIQAVQGQWVSVPQIPL